MSCGHIVDHDRGLCGIDLRELLCRNLPTRHRVVELCRLRCGNIPKQLYNNVVHVVWDRHLLYIDRGK